MAVGDRRLGGDGGQRSESGRRCQGHRDGGEQRSRRRQNINWFCFSDLFFPFFIILLFFFFNKPHHFLILIFFIGQVRSGTRVYTQKGVHQSFSFKKAIEISVRFMWFWCFHLFVQSLLIIAKSVFSATNNTKSIL
jgi:hypothetical protein